MSSRRVLVFVCALLAAGCSRTGLSHDDSDPPDGHSGLDVRTDALTGCQYLTVVRGGLTPRLDASGKQVCVADVGRKH